MRRWVASCALFLCLPLATAQAAPGDLDETFSRDGKVLDGVHGAIGDVAVQPDGRVLVATSRPRSGGAGADAAVGRYMPDGSLDAGFGNRGFATFELGESSYASHLDLRADGRIVVGGFIGEGGFSGDPMALSLLADGTRDLSFGGDGLVRVDFENNFETLGGMSVQPDGRLILASPFFDSDTGGRVNLARFEADGDPDPSFSGDGKARIDVGGQENGSADIALRPDGSVLVTAGGSLSAASDVVLIQVRPDGTLDPGFGTNGIARHDFGGSDSPSGAVILAEGRVAISGASCFRSLHEANCRPFVARFDANGGADPSFGSGGFRPAALAGDLVRQPDGRFVVAGPAAPVPTTATDFGLMRLTSGGAADAAFSGDGMVRTDFDFRDDFDGAVALAPDGRIVAAGRTQSKASLARYEVSEGPADADADGWLDTEDRCPSRFAMATRGCPRVPRRISLQVTEDARLRGHLKSVADSCVAKQRVKVYEVTRGRDRLIARRRTGAGGVWTIGRDLEGRFYARVGRVLEPSAGRCTGDRSRTVGA